MVAATDAGELGLISPDPAPGGHLTGASERIRPLLKGWSHLLAAFAATALCPLLIVFAADGTRAAAAIFSGCVVALFAISALYHRVDWSPRPLAILSRFDHSMIFVVIAATYTPIAVAALPEGTGRVILTVVWAGAAAGAIVHLLWPGAPRVLHVALYLVVGWVALAVIADLWRSLGVGGFALLVGGGLLHSVGAVIYARRRPDPWPAVFGFHEVFHLFVIGGIACHYVLVAFFVL